MGKRLAEPGIPVALRPVAEEIATITDEVCSAVLDEEYASLARRAVAKLARKRPSPLRSGRRATWAAGVVYALGQANFLSDPASEPCLSADQLSEAFGVAKSTMSNKARQVRDLLRISYFSPEFQRADMAAHNPLVWMVELDGLVVDARHIPVELQEEAFQRGLIPYTPALGREGTAAREASPPPGTTSTAVPSQEAGPGTTVPPGVAELLEHCSELKHQLVTFARSPRFSRQLDQAVSEGPSGGAADDIEFINLLDHFILQHPLSDGRTVAEVFTAEHPELTSADREMLLGWREVVEGVFAAGEQESGAFTAVNLVDELTYRIYSNAGPGGLAQMPPGCFLIARLVPFGDGRWMLSGAQRTLAASQRAAALQVAARMAIAHPRLVFRNPEKVTQGWQLAREQRALFIEHFGSDLVVMPGAEVASRVNGLLAWQARRSQAGIREAAAGTGEAAAPSAGTAPPPPQFHVPGDLASAASVALICDETEGLTFLANFRLVQEAFGDPALAADRKHRQAVLGYLRDDSISAQPFRRLAGADTARASQLFQRLLKRPGFCWERDGEALLRTRKPRCFSGQPHPPVTPLSSELSQALTSFR